VPRAPVGPDLAVVADDSSTSADEPDDAPAAAVTWRSRPSRRCAAESKDYRCTGYDAKVDRALLAISLGGPLHRFPTKPRASPPST